MKDILLQAYVMLKLVPLVLRLMTIFCLMGLLFVVSPFLPFCQFSIDGKLVTQEEFWHCGGATGMILTGLAMLATAVAILKKRHWARPALILLVPFADSIAILFDPSGWRELARHMLVWALLPTIPLIMYLYRKKNVNDYFNSDSRARTTA
jgi:hypothetical protein